MADPRPGKQDLELRQVSAFLRAVRIPYVRLERGPDPPDVAAHRNGDGPLWIEVTEHHPQNERVAVQKRWGQFQETIHPLIAAQPLLTGVHISLSFRDSLVPSRHRHAALANEAVRCALSARQDGWEGPGRRSICFLGAVMQQVGENDWVLPAAAWPELAAHVSQLELRYYPGLHEPLFSSNFQAQGAWSSPTGETLRDVLDRKETAMRAAIDQGRHTLGGPLWLLLVANNLSDMSSFAFASDRLKDALDDSGFDFGTSVFQEIWMLEGCGAGRARRLHPWDGLLFSPPAEGVGEG